MEKLKESSSLFEETQDGLVFGIPAVGIPELRQMCTMHQMREVNYYFRQVRPYLREIMNAPTNRESIQAAQKVASDLASCQAQAPIFCILFPLLDLEWSLATFYTLYTPGEILKFLQ